MKSLYPFLKRKNVQKAMDENSSEQPSSLQAEEAGTITPYLSDNLGHLKKTFDGCSDVVFREITFGQTELGFIVYIEGLANTADISDFALRPLIESKLREASGQLNADVLANSELQDVTELKKAADAVLEGNAVLFIDGYAEAFLLKVKGGVRRGVQEPETEAVIRGPREGFTENIRTNTALVRFRIKSPDLKMLTYQLGEKTKTSVVIAYMEGIAQPSVIKELKRRIESIEIDGVLESGYIEELIEDVPYSPFPQLQYSERPDTTAAQLLEGNFAIFVDGTPFVMIGPVVFAQFLQASEDYYERFMISTMVRWLRLMFLFLALFLPALYIATITFHQDMLPSTLILSIAAARESIPFPALIEAMIMEIAFEALREAGIRLPKTVGQAVSILGALVIGQAAVEAGIVSAPIVIIVAVTGIASFTIPRFNMAISIRMLRFPLMILAGLFGLFGIILGTLWIAVHLCHLRSFGVPYLSGFAPYMRGENKDIFVRVPWWKMIYRPRSMSYQNNRRMKSGMKPSPHSGEKGS